MMGSKQFIEIASSKLATELLVNANVKAGGNETAVKALTSLISTAADLLMSGKASPAEVSMKLAGKMADIIGLSEDQAILCGTALAQLVLTAATAPRDATVYSLFAGPEGGIIIEAAFVSYEALNTYMSCSLAYQDDLTNTPRWSAARAAYVSGSLNQLAKSRGATAAFGRTSAGSR